MIRAAAIGCLGSVILVSSIAAQDADVVTDEEPDALSVIEDQLREIVCAEASNFKSPVFSQAFSIARSNNYDDERFDDAIRDALTIHDNVDEPDFARGIDLALTMLPNSTLSEPERVSRLLTLMESESDAFSEYAGRTGTMLDVRKFKSKRIPVSNIMSHLSNYPVELATQLKPMLADDLTPLRCSLAKETDQHGEELLPYLLKAAQSDNRALKLAGMVSANSIVSMVRRTRQLDPVTRSRLPPGVDAKYFQVAQRIFDRYDKDRDDVLTESEWSKMLMSPSSADTNQDGLITVAEYALFMKRRQPGR